MRKKQNDETTQLKSQIEKLRQPPAGTIRVDLESEQVITTDADAKALAEDAFAKRFADHPMGDFHTFAGFDQIMSWEREFMGEEELAKYRDSVGHQPKAAE